MYISIYHHISSYISTPICPIGSYSVPIKKPAFFQTSVVSSDPDVLKPQIRDDQNDKTKTWEGVDFHDEENIDVILVYMMLYECTCIVESELICRWLN